VKEDKFLRTLDSLVGQTNNPALYDEKFLYENDGSTCSL
jgi:hypothetical protein